MKNFTKLFNFMKRKYKVDFDYRDKTTPIQIEGTTCCGVKDINRIQSINCSNPLRVINDIFLSGVNYSTVMFTTNGERGSVNVKRIKKVVEENNLGEFLSAKKNKNPNSGRYINVYLWTINKRNLTKFVNEVIRKQ